MRSAELDLLKLLCTDPPPFSSLSEDQQILLRYFAILGYVRFSSETEYSVLPEAKKALLVGDYLSEQHRHQEAQRNRDQRVQEAQAQDDKRKAAKHDYRIAAFEVILVYILGLLTPEKYLDEVIAFFKELIGQFLGLFH